MNPTQIRQFIAEWAPNKPRTIVIVDYANVDKWKDNLGWTIGVRELANLAKCFSSVKELRRFYYGSDFGSNTRSTTLQPWSKTILEGAQYNNMRIITKRVKYISGTNEKKCNLDVEMTLDLIKMRRQYDHVVMFTGDGDMAHALEYIKRTYQKNACVFGARDSMGSEITDALEQKIINKIMWAEDFESRLNMHRHRR
jgi:uncharacterized LabA/DUF88 family protein